MKIAFFTEMGFLGRVPRNHPNMRTEFAWMCALEADHIPIFGYQKQPEEQYDVGIVILPKKQIDKLMVGDLLGQLRRLCKKVVYMQEGPHDYFQDYPIEQQIWFYNFLTEMDMILCHNYSDIHYYEGLTKVPTYKMPTLLIEDNINTDIPNIKIPDKVIIGGNMCKWYGGFDSMIIAQEFDCPIYAPSMGRKISNEEHLDINHLPYMEWSEWMNQLVNYKFGVHLMRTHAAGTFALNLAYWGIPCIGYKGLDTQEMCHSRLSVDIGDLDTARELARRLKMDKNFYDECSHLAKQEYNKYWSEQTWTLNMMQLLTGLLNETRS